MELQSIPPQLWLAAFQLVLNALGWWLAVRLLPEERVAMAHWAGFMACLALGLVLAGLRVGTPERSWWLFNGVNVATLTGFWLMRRGTERFLHTGRSDAAQAGLVLPALLALLWMPPSLDWAPQRAALAYGVQALVVLAMAHSVCGPLHREFGKQAVRALLPPMVLIGAVQLALAARQLLGVPQEVELHHSNRFNQGVLYVYLSGSAVFGFGFMHLVALRLTHQLRESSERDALTQLLNRRAMAERVRAAWRSQRRRGTPLAFVMLDIDHFKRVNDEQGHAAGDAVLQRLAQLLREQLRGEDLVARMGGEEFLLVLPDTDAEAATRLAERLREATQAARLGVTLSLGLTLADAEDRDEEAALRRADAALYRAKALGRDRLEVASLSPVPDR